MRNGNDFKCKRWLGLTVNTKNKTQNTQGWRKISPAFCLLSGKCISTLKLSKHHELWKSETLFCSLGLSNVRIGRLQCQRIARKGTTSQLIASWCTRGQLPCCILSLGMRRKNWLYPSFIVYKINWMQSEIPLSSMSQALPIKNRRPVQ